MEIQALGYLGVGTSRLDDWTALATGGLGMRGRHPNDLMNSFYMRTPSDALLEYGWGGREVDDGSWQAHELHGVESFWGHDGLLRAVGGKEPRRRPTSGRAPAAMPCVRPCR